MAESVSFSYLQTSNNRLSGLASGMDIDSIVEKLMKAESAKMEKLQQQKQRTEWQRDAYRDINSKLEAFRTDAFDNYKASSFLRKSASVTDSSKIDVTATASANGTLNISSATLAQNATSVKQVLKSDGITNAMNTTELSELGLGDGTLKLNVVQNGEQPKVLTVAYTANDTLQTLASKINNQNTGLTAIVGEDGKFSLSTEATGAVSDGLVSINSDTNGLMSKLGFTETAGNGLLNGVDATYTTNGITKTSDTNIFTELGYQITLKQPIQTGSVTITSSTDTDAIVEKVKSFVELYNGLAESLTSKIKERKAYDYQPLTDSQKVGMSEDEIKKWEEKAKQGILRNDTVLSNVVSNMREIIYDVTTTKDTTYNALYNIGITTSKEERSTGKLSIDETKLRKAIEANPEAVSDLFTKAEVKGADNTVIDKGGLITQLRATAKSAIDSIEEKAGKTSSVENTYTLGKNIISLNQRIEDWKDRLKEIEERYFKQFTAMENAINKANSQSSLFMQ